MVLIEMDKSLRSEASLIQTIGRAGAADEGTEHGRQGWDAGVAARQTRIGLTSASRPSPRAFAGRGKERGQSSRTDRRWYSLPRACTARCRFAATSPHRTSPRQTRGEGWPASRQRTHTVLVGSRLREIQPWEAVLRGIRIPETERSRELRRDATSAERKIWAGLRNRQCGGHKFVRQERIGPYQCGLRLPRAQAGRRDRRRDAFDRGGTCARCPPYRVHGWSRVSSAPVHERGVLRGVGGRHGEYLSRA